MEMLVFWVPYSLPCTFSVAVGGVTVSISRTSLIICMITTCISSPDLPSTLKSHISTCFLTCLCGYVCKHPHVYNGQHRWHCLLQTASPPKFCLRWGTAFHLGSKLKPLKSVSFAVSITPPLLHHSFLLTLSKKGSGVGPPHPWVSSPLGLLPLISSKCSSASTSLPDMSCLKNVFSNGEEVERKTWVWSCHILPPAAPFVLHFPRAAVSILCAYWAER